MKLSHIILLTCIFTITANTTCMLLRTLQQNPRLYARQAYQKRFCSNDMQSLSQQIKKLKEENKSMTWLTTSESEYQHLQAAKILNILDATIKRVEELETSLNAKNMLSHNDSFILEHKMHYKNPAYHE